MIFRKKLYHFNPVSLTFEEIKSNRKHKLYLMLCYFILFTLIAIGSGYVLNQLFDSGESMFLESKLSNLKTQMKFALIKGQKIAGEMHNDLFVKDNKYRTILQMDTVPYSVRIAGTGGSANTRQIAMEDDLSYRVSEMINSLTNQIQMQSGSLKQLYEKAMEYSVENTHLPAIQPIAREDLIMISSDFGVRSDPFFFVNRVHCGLDFVAAIGKNVYATGDGIVTFTETSRNGYGNEIMIDHKFGFSTRYAHLHTIEVKSGEMVKRGQVIGTVGESGRATGPHLHYEVLYNRQPVNPSFYFDTSLTREEFAQIVNKANTESN